MQAVVGLKWYILVIIAFGEDELTAASKDELRKIIEDLTGQNIPFPKEIPDLAVQLLTEKNSKGMGYSQFNELLLNLGYDRVSHSFFQYLANQRINYQTGTSLKSLEEFRKGVDAFRKVAILFFGNIKFAFKNLSRDASFLRDHLRRFSQRREESFYARHQQIMTPNTIAGEETYLLGYVIKRDLEERLKKDPNNTELQKLEEKRKIVVEKGRKNHDGYLVSDHLDVYIATSMRERHEFIAVHNTTRSIFAHDALVNLKLRWFDPTQAFCEDRIDKGISEGLMLRRAKCTIYFAQETDTLGKDSELASTLAQGKPVIAYVPKPEKTAAEDLLKQVADKTISENELILKQLRVYDPDAAWNDQTIREWLDSPGKMVRNDAVNRLQLAIEAHFTKRNSLLRDVHPLGVQMNLATGVANGVLVANSVDECARLVRALLLRELEFELTSEIKGEHEYLYLRETITKSIFRVVSGDAFLTNAFWNFYLNPTEETYAVTDNEDADYKKSPNDPYDLARSKNRQSNLFNFPEKT